MKTYKVLETHLYERLMCILKDEQYRQPAPATGISVIPQPTSEINLSEQASIEATPVEIEPIPSQREPELNISAQEEKPEYTYVINYQMGDGIKRAPLENWL